jgi:hypothetical protein
MDGFTEKLSCEREAERVKISRDLRNSNPRSSKTFDP